MKCYSQNVCNCADCPLYGKMFTVGEWYCFGSSTCYEGAPVEGTFPEECPLLNVKEYRKGWDIEKAPLFPNTPEKK